MRIDVLTIFPNMISPMLGESILKRAIERRLIQVHIHDIRKFTTDRHRKVDDKPFGGGPGMVMSPQPIFDAVEFLKRQRPKLRKRVILLSAAGKKFNQAIAKKLSAEKHLILICGHYEGVDERVMDIATDEISIGDYVLTGGEIPALVIIDSVARLIPKVLGDERSPGDDSFSKEFVEYPHYTRPSDFRGSKVPKVLLTGDHQKIEKWRRQQAIKKTMKNRPDLVRKDR